ncbi:MAG TPA: XdhC family protein [Cystobacter sp.]
MRELSEVLTAYRAARASGEPLLLATLVRVEGSTYRRPGARMLMTGERQLAGGISGGCLESDVLRKALWRTEQGEAVVIQYDSRADDEFAFTMGLGCNGLVELLLERLEGSRPHVLDFLERSQSERVAAAIATVVVSGTGGERVGARVMRDALGRTGASVQDEALRALLLEDLAQALASGRSGYQRRETDTCVVEVAIEVVAPPVPLVLFGTGFDVHPVVELAKNIGWHVTVVGTRPTGNLKTRFPRADAWVGARAGMTLDALNLDARTLAVLMTHNFTEDEELLSRLLPSPVRYIGVLGPRRRLERLLTTLEGQGVRPTAAQLSRLYGPVGLDIGAEGADEIALSIVSELQAFVAGREGGALRQRPVPIHPDPEPFVPLPLPRAAENIVQATCALES